MPEQLGAKEREKSGPFYRLIEDMSNALKSCGHTGGRESELIMKSGGEPALIALKEAVMKDHGG